MCLKDLWDIFFIQKSHEAHLQFKFSCMKSLLGVKKITDDLYAAVCGQ